MTELKNELIRASAGTGKTHSLVQRYLWLLEHGAEPERIAAMTFTRKAAGEFFERILQELATRSMSTAGGGAALVLLRKVVRRMDQLRLGTIDSFFATMTQCLPFELGLTGKAALMSEAEATRAEEEVMDSLLLAIGRMNDAAALDELREAWKAASHGTEQGRPAEALATWCGRLHQLLIECPDPLKWGGAEAIWDAASPAFPISAAGQDLAAAVDRLEGVLDYAKFDKRAPQKWDDFFQAAREYDGFQKFDKPIVYMLDSDRGDHSRLRLGGVEWKIWKAVPLDRQAGNALADVLEILVARALLVHLRRTRSQREIVRIYETTYHRQVRSRGRLVFSDLAWLLCGRVQTTAMAEHDWEAMRTALEFRMDAKYDHWLLDEFQDTSERQWEVMSPLLEEARQDPEERRSVFLVGDVKQSIYLWRQAEPELFHHVETAWSGHRLQTTPLNESYRSCPQVLGMVNGVFLNAERELEALFPGLGRLWKFEEHRCSARVARLAGHAALVHVAALDEETTEEDGPITLGAANLIREINPIGRGLTCAVLVRSNRTARALSDALRRLLGMEVICESQENVVVDNPSTLALLSLLQVAVHPGDSTAWEHLLMSPLREAINTQRLTRPALTARVRADLSNEGFLPVLQKWAEILRQALPAQDAFTSRRLAQLLDLAADFDESGSRDVGEFLSTARDHSVREDSASAQAIQVMTVHQSKGLQFDVVILPELQGEALDAVQRNRLFVARKERGTVGWMLDKPEKVVVERDDVLLTEQRREKARQAFEGLCRFYVAMTRAKLGLYVLLDPKKVRASNNEGRLLAMRLEPGFDPGPYDPVGVGGLATWEVGDRSWYLAHEVTKVQAQVASAVVPDANLGLLIRAVNKPLERRAPSGEESFVLRGGELLSTAREVKRQHGTRVHELFSAIAWLEDVPDAVALWKTKGWVAPDLASDGAGDPAAEEVLRVLSAPEVQPWFRQGGQRRTAWMERRFDYIEKGGWVSGIVDRVVVEWDERGDPIRATILDFKTDAVATEEDMAARAAGYAPQLALYVPAVMRMTGLKPEAIHKALIFTMNGRVVLV